MGGNGCVERVVNEEVGGVGQEKVGAGEVGMNTYLHSKLDLGWGLNWELKCALQGLGTICVSLVSLDILMNYRGGGEGGARKEIRSVLIKIRLRKPSHCVFRESTNKRR